MQYGEDILMCIHTYEINIYTYIYIYIDIYIYIYIYIDIHAGSKCLQMYKYKTPILCI